MSGHKKSEVAVGKKKKGVSGSLLAFAALVSGVIGGLAGLILAPQPGKKTREQIRESYDEASKKMNEYVKKTEERFPDATARIREGQGQLREKISQSKNRVVAALPFLSSEGSERGKDKPEEERKKGNVKKVSGKRSSSAEKKIVAKKAKQSSRGKKQSTGKKTGGSVVKRGQSEPEAGKTGIEPNQKT